MPAWNDLIEKYDLSELRGGGDLVVKAGDIAVARTGDLMLGDEEYSALFRCVNMLRYSWPALAQAFALIQQASDADAVLDLEAAMPLSSDRSEFLKPERLASLRDAMERRTAKEASALVSAEGVLMTGSRLLLSLKQVMDCSEAAWTQAEPKIKGHSVGKLFEAAANHLRHCEEWRLSGQLQTRQRRSIEVLATLIDEPIVGDRHTFGSSRSIEILGAVAGLSLDEFAGMLLKFANNLTKIWRQRPR